MSYHRLNHSLAVAAVLALAVPTSMAGVSQPTSGATPETVAAGPAAHKFAVQKKKKKHQGRNPKKTEPPVATANATFVFARTAELQGGIETEKLTVVIKNAQAKVKDDVFGIQTARGTARGTVEYAARFYTEDRSWQIGCDTEIRESTASWSGELRFTVDAVAKRYVQGNPSKVPNGWRLGVALPDMAATTTGSFLEWDSILEDTCLTVPNNVPLGWWSPGFPGSGLISTGSLNSDGKGVILNSLNTALPEQTGSVDGRITFAPAVK